MTRPRKGSEVTARERAGQRVRGASEGSEVVVTGDHEHRRVDRRGVAGFLLDGEVFSLHLELERAPLHGRHQLPCCGARLGATPGVDVQGRRRSEIASLEREKLRWKDPAYVVAQARARFAFGFPGEIGFQVLDEDGKPLDHEDSLSDPTREAEDPEWWQETVSSIEAAGNPPDDNRPATKITVPQSAIPEDPYSP